MRNRPLTKLAAVGLLVSSARALTASAVPPQFTDVSTTVLAEAMVEKNYWTGGAAVGDCDRDGWPDLVLSEAGDLLLLRNRGDGSFERLPTGTFRMSTRAAAFGDVDNDGDLDLYASGYSQARHFLLLNDGTCSFGEVAVERGVAVLTRALGRSVSMADYDRDGYLDIFVAELQSDLVDPDVPPPVSHLFRNRGASAPGHFEDVTIAAGLAQEPVVARLDGVYPFVGRFTDFDRDGWLDFALISDFSESRFYWNTGDGRFSDGTVSSRVGTDEHGMGAITADFDGDGRFDLFVTSIFVAGLPNATGNRLYRYTGNRSFTDVTDEAGVRNGDWGWGTDAFDYDNDGDLDLLMTNGVHTDGDLTYTRLELGDIDLEPLRGAKLRFWRNDGSGRFTEIAGESGLVHPADQGQGVLPFDYDRDGDLDVLLTHEGGEPIRLFRNDGGNAKHWLEVELTSGVGPRDGIGAVVTLTAGPETRPQVREVSASSTYLVQNGTARVHFGLGEHASPVASVRIDWPHGIVQTVTDVPIDSVLSITQIAATPTPHPTPTLSPTATRVACPADCDGNGAVTIDELITAVSIALGNGMRERCPAGDRDGNGTITIDEIVQGVNSSLRGCG